MSDGLSVIVFFSKDTTTTEIYTLSLHDALPILKERILVIILLLHFLSLMLGSVLGKSVDRKSGSAGMPRPISYAVFCLKKKKTLNIDSASESDSILLVSSSLTINHSGIVSAVVM